MTEPTGSPVATVSNHTSRFERRAITLAALAMVVMGLVLLYLLIKATSNNPGDYEKDFAKLLVVNATVAALLFIGIVWMVVRLFRRLRQGRFGSRLLAKLSLMFALAGIAPGLIIYFVSYQFVTRSIASWFDVKVEGALKAGQDLGRVTLETLSKDLAAKSRVAAAQIAQESPAQLGEALDRVGEQLGTSELSVWADSGKLIASATLSSIGRLSEKPTTEQLRMAKSQSFYAWTEGLEDETSPNPPTNVRNYVLVLLPANGLALNLNLNFNPEARYLMVSRKLPENLVVNSFAVVSANREYQERALGRKGLTLIYTGTLTLSLFLAVFGAVLLAVLFGNQIARPLLLLAEGVSQVAAGDLTPKLSLQGKDELGGLTRAFATMTAQLSQARHDVEHSMGQVDAARANLQTILDNLTSGVIVLGLDGAIRSSNPGATRILTIALSAYEGVALEAVPGLEAFGAAVQLQFAEFVQNRAERNVDHWQRSFELGGSVAPMHTPFNRALTLVARGAELPGDARLLVFDDISEIVSAQRAQAWGEVARRLAHEIKNPLTPIQLSAERLAIKLNGKIEPALQTLLNKSVKTIVDQVSAMQRLVNEFRDYARLPSAELKPLDLNALVQEVLHLYEADFGGTAIAVELAQPCPQVMGDAQQLRQVIHNLLQNAQDAMETASNTAPQGENIITIRTQYQESSGKVRLSVIDSGTGFPEPILKRAFEPYVTTKSKGTGLGLAVVKRLPTTMARG